MFSLANVASPAPSEFLSARSISDSPAKHLTQQTPDETLQGTFDNERVLTFLGSIDNRLGIHLTLEKSEGSLRGTYSYDRIGTPIELRGAFDATNGVVLDEFDQSGASAARFTGKFVSKGILAGTWKKANSGKELLFLLEASAQGHPNGATDRAIVVEERIVVDGGMWRGAKVCYPTISGLRDTSVLHKVRAAATLKKLLGSSPKEYRHDWGLHEVNYRVNYNRDHILDITFWESGAGAYDFTSYSHIAFNLNTGAKLTAADVFEPSSMPALEALVKRKLHSYDRVTEGFVPRKRYHRKDLNIFRVDERGVTFLWEFGFPHGGESLEPRDGGFFFTYAELKNYISPGGLLGVNIR
jgi:hypothetical protein